ncbi:hypothetical protein [Agromyces archimandritae]|uniref:Uncharacterized protein n=1 Tax=Agromyces archimandritae TaxID=2781962 RepID=A0A975FQT3_9MICO|nr:hypothetical protein [Agromyces archimandritae]QTX05521.1 hypothetical protein G127AT_04705 [Agromyces archimandritae]
MSTAPATASDWAKALPRGGRVPWDELEAHVLRGHDELLRLLGDAAYGVRRRNPVVTVLGRTVAVIAGVIALAVVWAPIWGIATLRGDAFGIVDVDGAAAIPVAGASAIVSICVQIALLVSAARGRPGTSGIGGGSALLSAFMLAGIIVVGVRQGVPGWPAWAAVAALAAVLGVVAEIAERRAVRALPDGLPARPAEPAGDRLDREQRIDAAVQALPSEERARLLAERRAAIEWLRMVGTVDRETAARAIRAPLGRLGSSI